MIIRERTHTSMQGLRVGKTSESPSSDTTAESEADEDSSILNRRRRLNDYSHPLILLSLSELSNRWLNGFYRSPTNASTAALTAILCVFHFVPVRTMPIWRVLISQSMDSEQNQKKVQNNKHGTDLCQKRPINTK